MIEKMKYRILIPVVLLFVFACNNNDMQRTNDAAKDSTAATGSGTQEVLIQVNTLTQVQ